MSLNMSGHCPIPRPLSASNPSPPRLTWYITRSNGTHVPLIPADEIPYGVRIQGVPRVLNNDQVFALTPVALVPYTGQVYRLEDDNTIKRSSSQPGGQFHSHTQSTGEVSRFLPPDAFARRSPPIANATSNPSPIRLGQPSAADISQNWRQPLVSDSSQVIIDNIVRGAAESEAVADLRVRSNSPFSLPPSGNVPNQEKKEYCTHWIRHGECDYMQQGCLYKHEMPDFATLQKIGFRTIPRWWLETTMSKPTPGSSGKPVSWRKHKGIESTVDETPQSGRLTPVSSSGSSITRATTVTQDEAKTPATVKPTDTTSVQAVPKTEVQKIPERMVEDLLIDFKPLVPTPSSNCSSPSPTSNPEHLPNGFGVNPKARAFVPAGEPADSHVAAVKKRAPDNPQPAPRVVREVEPTVPAKEPPRAPKDMGNSGIMGSKWAKLPDETAPVNAPKPRFAPKARYPRKPLNAPKPIEKNGTRYPRGPKDGSQCRRGPPRSSSSSSSGDIRAGSNA